MKKQNNTTKKPMKTKILISLLILLSVGCEYQKRSKPFVIVYKTIHDYDNISLYAYQDAFGNRYEFFELSNKYNIGDTIK